MSLVRVVQSFLASFVLKILHKFLIGFKSGEFHGQSRTLIRAFFNLTQTQNFSLLFLQNGRETNLLEKYCLQLEMSIQFL